MADDEFVGQIAQFAFVREEREREVRLLFRDVSAAELAVSFRRAGAALISLMVERPNLPVQPPTANTTPTESDDVPQTGKRRRKAAEPTPEQPACGELLMRYFYVLGEMVYTVSIAVSSGVAQSIANIYPNAALPERDAQNRMGVIFVD